MFEPDINTPTTGDLHHQDPSARAAPLQTMQETKEAEELSTRVTLDGIWLEIYNNPQLKHALWALWIPEALKSLVDAVALGYKGMAGKLPNSHTTVIMILERAGRVLSELPLPENDTHLDQSISCLRQAVLLSPGDDNRMPTRLINLGLALLRRAENRNTVPDISQAIEHLTRAHHLNQTIDRLRNVITWMLGLAYVARFKSCKEIRDIDAAIGYQTQAISLIRNENEDIGRFLITLGCSYSLRFEQSGALKDINSTIEQMTEGLGVTLEGDSSRMEILSLLGDTLRRRFDHLGELRDINRAIAYQSEAVLLTPDGHIDKPGRLSELGNSYRCRFDRLGELADIQQAIACQLEAKSMTSEGHSDKPRVLDYLGSSYMRRFELLGEFADINRATACQSEAVSLIPDGQVSKAMMLSNLGASFLQRFVSLGDTADIDQAVTCTSKAVFLTADGHAYKPTALNNLGLSYQSRFDRLGNLADLDQAIQYASKAVLHTPDGHADKPRWLTNLGCSRQCRFERLGELTDINQAIACQSEAVFLTPDGHAGLPAALNHLGSSYRSRFERLGDLTDIDQAIAYHAKAVLMISDEHAGKPIAFNSLGISHQIRFKRLGELADVDRAIECHANAVFLTREGHASKPGRLDNLGSSYQYRFTRLGELADINRAIECHSEAVSLTPNGHTAKLGMLSNLGSSYQRRFGRLGNLTDIDRAIEYHSEMVSLAPSGRSDKFISFYNLGSSHQRRFESLNELVDIEKAIVCQSKAVSLAPDGHADEGVILNDLGLSYRYRFDCLNEPEDIERAIAYQSEATLVTPDGHVDKPGWLRNLGDSHLYRFDRLGEAADLDRSMSLFQMASRLPTGRVMSRFKAARSWARLASRKEQNPLSAYSRAMELVPKIIWIGSTVSSRYDNINSIGTVVAEAAAAAISLKEYGLALEWLEAGRSIVWNQTLQLRTPFDDLHAVAPNLAKGLKQIAQELEATGQRFSGTTEADPQPLEAVAQRHRRLAEEYEAKIAEAQQLPGLHDFMRPKKAAELILTTKSGPIVVINVHPSRCDALIIRPHSEEIAHVPLSDLSYDDVADLQKRIKGWITSGRKRQERPIVSDSRLLNMPEHRFGGVLADLWHKIVKPVLDSLGYLIHSPDGPLPHITWCTTGALSFLPIHAAGCYDQPGPKIFDFVVSSYAPSLSALIAATSGSLEIGGVLAVSQEDDSLLGTKDELAHIQRHAKLFSYKELKNDKATPKTVLEAMVEYSSVHLACHGRQNPELPAKSCFRLHDGDLTLEEITKRSLKNKGLAFLSACQTATGDEGMPDEAVHLAAGMLVAGYSTVIATMWPITDADAPAIANRVYEELLIDGNLGEARVARALQAAVKDLRKEIGDEKFYRWVPYIHLGV